MAADLRTSFKSPPLSPVIPPLIAAPLPAADNHDGVVLASVPAAVAASALAPPAPAPKPPAAPPAKAAAAIAAIQNLLSSPAPASIVPAIGFPDLSMYAQCCASELTARE